MSGNLSIIEEIQLVEALVQSAPSAHFAIIAAVAALSALAWDTLLTLNEEKSYIWTTKVSFLKFVFLIVRYLALALQIANGVFCFALNVSFSDAACAGYKWFLGFGGVSLAAAADSLLVYRVYAFYGKHQSFLYFLVILYLCTQATVFTLAGLFVSGYLVIQNPIPQFSPIIGDCITIQYPLRLAFIWVVILIFHSTIFILVIARVIYTRYGSRALGIPLSPLYTVFIRDGIWAYSLILLNSILCVIFNHQTTSSLIGASFIFFWFTTSSVCSCRLILNLQSIIHVAVPITSIPESIPLKFRNDSINQSETLF